MRNLFFLFVIAVLCCPRPVFAGEYFYTILISRHETESAAVVAVSALTTKGFDAFYRYAESPQEKEKFKVYVGNFPSKHKAIEMLNNLLNADLSQTLTLTRLKNLTETAPSMPVPAISAAPMKAAPPVHDSPPSEAPANLSPVNLSPTNLSIDNMLSLSLKLYHEEKYFEAIPIFDQILEEDANPDIMYWAARCAAKTSAYDTAIMHYNNILTIEHNAPQVLLELSDIYLKQNKYQEALSTLEKAKALSPPPDVLKNINLMKEDINTTIRKLTWKLSASQGAGYDGNINCGLVDNRIDNIPGTLTEKKDSMLWVSFLNAELDYDIGKIKHFYWKNTADIYNNHYTEDSRYNFAYIDLSSGPSWKNVRTRINFPLEFIYKRYGKASLSNTFSTGPDIEYFLSDTKTVSLNGAYRISAENFSNTLYEEQGYDQTSQRLSMGPRFYLSTLPGTVTVIMGFENHNAKNDILSYTAVHLTAALDLKFTTGTAILCEYGFMDRTYKDTFSFMTQSRQDDCHTIILGISQTFFKYCFVATDFLYIDNQSNDDLFAFTKKRWQVSGGVKF